LTSFSSLFPIIFLLCVRETQSSGTNHSDVSRVSTNSNSGSVSAAQEQSPTWAHIARGENKERGIVDIGRMPGTNWCGKGWRADSPLDMGGYAAADRCCRHHDLGCPLSIEPGVTKWGLSNVRVHAVMHCACDERFRSCLKLARTQAADIVGNLFFNIINIPCFVFSKNKVCVQRNWWGSCTQYSTKTTAVWKKPISYYN